MAVIKTFGYKIFRVREVRTENEYLIYDTKRKVYNQYAKTRALSVLDEELKLQGYEIKEYLDQYGLDSSKPEKALQEWFITESVLIDNVSYKPVESLTFEENGKVYFNTYNKSKYLSMKVKPKEFPIIQKILMNLVGNEIEGYDWFCNWLAWQIQNPLDRLPTGIIFQGEQGTGKSVFCSYVLKNIFGDNYREIGQAQINGDFNDFMLGKQLIVANEVIHNDNKYLVPDKLKNFMTDEYVAVNIKFKDPITAKNYTQWIYLSNNQIPVKIDKDDRRYTVVLSCKLENGFELVSNLLSNLEEELEGFVYYLKSLDPKFELVSQPLLNQARKDLIQAGGNSIDNFMNTILSDFNGVFEQLDNFYPNYSLDVYKEEDTGLNYICTSQLYEIYKRFVFEEGYKSPTSKNVFSRNLSKYGISSKVKRIDGFAVRTYLYHQKEFLKNK